MDLNPVSAILSGRLSLAKSGKLKVNDDDENSNDPDKLWSSFISNGLTGLAFVAIALILTITNAAGGSVWGFWMLIPGGACLGKGLSSYLKAKRLERREAQFLNRASNNFLPDYAVTQTDQLPPQRETFANFYQAPAPNTGELIEPPQSVTEHTTRHLQTTHESETINLPIQK